jgi:hypothetical protein
MERRSFLRTGLSAVAGSFIISGRPGLHFRGSDTFELPVRQLTNGPGYHWFGYYDKLQTDPSGRYILGMQVPFEMRTPESNDEIIIGMVDTKDQNRWIDIGRTRAWSWQQGCMLQWVPGSKDQVIWNDRGGDGFVSHIVNIKTSKERTLPGAIYALSPDGKWAVGTEFSRIQDLRPGYGYAGIRDPFFDKKAPEEIGLYRMDIDSGDSKMLFSLADMASIPHNGEDISDNYHWFNHLLVNTDGTRFTFLHRWRNQRSDRQKMASGGFTTRMITASSDGGDHFIIDPSGFTSHFVWSDPSHICAWTKPAGEKPGFYFLEDKTGTWSQTGKGIMTMNGHNTFVPGTKNEWILCDTYPQGTGRMQELYLYHIPSGRKVILGNFNSPSDYKGEWRCDLHPKCTPDGTMVIFDSTHSGEGRQIFTMDISSTLKT